MYLNYNQYDNLIISNLSTPPAGGYAKAPQYQTRLYGGAEMQMGETGWVS